MDTKSPPSGREPGRDFYEQLSRRALPPSTVRGIHYRNLVVANEVRGRDLRVLEVGPGEGWLCRLLRERGHRVVAVDLARGWLTAIPSDTILGGATAPMTCLPFATGSFDAVVAAEVVEHIPDPAAALGEAARVLVPGGRLVVTVPYRETLELVRCPKCGDAFEPNGHLHSFDETRLSGLLRSAGLEPTGFFVGPTRFSREVLRRAPIQMLLPLLKAMDRVSYRWQRVSDTWMLMTARRP